MAEPPPKQVKEIIGLSSYGVDTNGNHVFFGFKALQARLSFTTNYKALRQLINYLQMMGNEAQQRRLKLDATASDLEARKRRSNPVVQAALEPDIAGTSAALVCTTLDGTRVEAQLNFDMIQSLLQHLPETIAEMERRQAAHQKSHSGESW